MSEGFVCDLMIEQFGAPDEENDRWTPDVDMLYHQLNQVLTDGLLEHDWSRIEEAITGLQALGYDDMAWQVSEFAKENQLMQARESARLELKRQSEAEAEKEVQLNLFEEIK